MDRAPYVPPVYGDEGFDLPAAVRHAVDLIEASTKSEGPIGRSAYRFECNRSTFEINNGLKYDEWEGITLDVESATLLVLLLQGWLEWRKSMG